MTTEVRRIDRLRAAIDETEAWARAASKAYPYTTDPTVPASGVRWQWVTGENWEPATPDPALDEFVAPPGETCNLATVEKWAGSSGHPMPNTYADSIVEMDSAAAGHIIRHDPAAVLRRCAADRKLVDLVERVVGEQHDSSEAEAKAWLMIDVFQLVADAYGVTRE